MSRSMFPAVSARQSVRNAGMGARRTSGRLARRTGFTLTEVLIAIAIVVVLAGIVAVNVMGTRRSSMLDVARMEINAFESAIEQFEITFNRVPTDEEGLEVLWSKEALVTDNEADEQRWRAFLKAAKINDPWGNPYNYRAESEHGLTCDIWSNGPDGEEGTDDDIANWTGRGTDTTGSGGLPLPSSGQ
jgi:general secretion pathway protein G